MENLIYLAADELMSTSFEYTVNRPIDKEMLQTLKELSISERGIYSVVRNDKDIKGTLEWEKITHRVHFEYYFGLSSIKVEVNNKEISLQKARSAVAHRVLKAMAEIPQAKELTIISSKTDRTSVSRDYFYINQWTNVFNSIEKLQLKGLTQAEIDHLPKTMPNLKKLSCAGTISLEWLNELDVPHLEVIDAWEICGLDRISDLTDRFPHLKKICIRNTQDIYKSSSPMRLGKVSETLTFLDLACAKFQDPENLKNSNLQNFRLIGCEFDPSILPECSSLCAIELDHVILTKDIPMLAPLKHLNYLILVDCGLHDLSFVQGLHNLQIFNVLENPLKVTLLTELTQEYPPELSFLADMPNLLELCMEEKIIKNLSEFCKPIKKHFSRVYTDMLRP